MKPALQTFYICSLLLEDQRQGLTRYVSGCIKKGIEAGDRSHSLLPIALRLCLIAFVNGLLRRRSLKLDQVNGLKEAAVDFCKRSLSKRAEGVAV